MPFLKSTAPQQRTNIAPNSLQIHGNAVPHIDSGKMNPLARIRRTNVPSAVKTQGQQRIINNSTYKIGGNAGVKNAQYDDLPKLISNQA